MSLNQAVIEEQLKQWILLDNQSNISIFNPNFVSDQKTVNKPLRLATNRGILTTHNKAQVPGFGEVWFDDKAITNIFSFSAMEDKYRITYDSSIEKVFKVHLPNKIIKFKRSDNGLYYTIADYAKKLSSKIISNIKYKLVTEPCPDCQGEQIILYQVSNQSG